MKSYGPDCRTCERRYCPDECRVAAAMAASPVSVYRSRSCTVTDEGYHVVIQSTRNASQLVLDTWEDIAELRDLLNRVLPPDFPEGQREAGELR